MTHRAAVIGSPIDHSLSPTLHRAAYSALRLADWSFDRLECSAEQVGALVSGLGPDWVGLAVTMPCKRAALDLASEATRRAQIVGAANTLIPVAGKGWLADCTDVDGVIGALRYAAGVGDTELASAVILGAGGTASAAIAGLSLLGVSDLTLVVREPSRARESLECADRVGIAATVLRWADTDFAGLVQDKDALISTVPSGAILEHVDHLARARHVLDVIYHPWPTPLAQAVARYGGRIATGLDMLLHQAFGQVEHFTRMPAPREAMRLALRETVGKAVELPIA